MKTTILSFVFLIATFFTAGQLEAQSMESKAKSVLIETGSTGILGFIPTSGTGLGLVFDGGTSILSLNFEGGYMLSERTALKARLGIISFDGTSIFGFTVGPKFYTSFGLFADLSAGLLSAAGESAFQANLAGGYAIKLKDNINLEPSLGLLITEGGSAGVFGLKFALFL